MSVIKLVDSEEEAAHFCQLTSPLRTYGWQAWLRRTPASKPDNIAHVLRNYDLQVQSLH